MPQLNDAQHWNNTLDLRHLLGTGLLYSTDVAPFSLASLATRTFQFDTGIRPVYQVRTRAVIIGSRDVEIETFVGGSLSAGSLLFQFPSNHWRPFTPPPYLQILDDVTVDVAGTLISRKHFGADDTGGDTGGTILAPNTTYYVTVTNVDVQAADAITLNFAYATWLKEAP